MNELMNRIEVLSKRKGTGTPHRKSGDDKRERERERERETHTHTHTHTQTRKKKLSRFGGLRTGSFFFALNRKTLCSSLINPPSNRFSTHFHPTSTPRSFNETCTTRSCQPNTILIFNFHELLHQLPSAKASNRKHNCQSDRCAFSTRPCASIKLTRIYILHIIFLLNNHVKYADLEIAQLGKIR